MPESLPHPAAARPAEPLVSVRMLSKHFGGQAGLFSRRDAPVVRAVDGVSFDIARGETLGVVGESGCGKSTTGRLLIRMLDATGGHVLYEGVDLLQLDRQRMREYRRKVSIVFQVPFASLNPRMTVGSIIAEPMDIHGLYRGGERRRRLLEIMDRVGLPAAYLQRHPHEFSGGQRQRIGIGRALALDPDFVVCDEAVSALDVSIQAQIINLLDALQRERGLTYFFISHNLAVVRHIADRVAVMYLGRVVEIAPTRELYANPRHPYTHALLSSIPVPVVGAARERIELQGDLPSPLDPPSGCRFHTRCPLAKAECKSDDPPLRKVADAQGGAHYVACHFA